MSNKFIWGSPEGEMFLLRSKEDVALLVNKVGFDDFTKLEQVGITPVMRQMTQEELNEDGLVFNIECPEDTDIFSGEYVSGLYVAPIFNPNPYFEVEKESSYQLATWDLRVQVGVDNFELTEAYQFPCVAYIYLEGSFDRGGDTSIFIWNVTPLDNMFDMKAALQLESTLGDKRVDKHEALCLVECLYEAQESAQREGK
mgnify:CR=1 FL=1